MVDANVDDDDDDDGFADLLPEPLLLIMNCVLFCSC